MTERRRPTAMSDAELSAQLRRRAQPSTGDSGWLRGQLLPEVNEAIDARPQPMQSSRRAPAGALVALAAVVVLLVVVPRLALAPGPDASPTVTKPPSGEASPAPVTPAPTLGPPEIVTAAEFGAKLAAGELDGTTVIVDGRIAAGSGRGPQCPLGGPCLMGTLDGADPTVEVYSPHLPTTRSRAAWTIDDGETWGWWVSPQQRQGLLMLLVNRAGSVEYLGTMHRPDDADVWLPSEVRRLDIESIDQFEVLIVDGWLWNLQTRWDDGPVACAGVGIPDALPDGQCNVRGGLLTDWRPSTDWLTALPPRNRVRLDAPADAVELAGDPLYLVGGEERRQPVHGRFAIAPRLWAGGCAAESGPIGPCWQWQMLGVLAVTNTGEASSSSAPAPTAGQLTSSPVTGLTPSPGAYEPAWWELAPFERPTDESTSLALVVNGPGCRDGRIPEHRIVGRDIEYAIGSVTITFTVLGDPAGRDCDGLPGNPLIIDLDEPLGPRALIDGGQGVMRVLEHGPALLGMANPDPRTAGTFRFLEHLGPDACFTHMEFDRELPDPLLYEAMANELAEGAGFLDGGRAWLGDPLDAARAFGAFEAIEGQTGAWYFLAHPAGQAWLPADTSQKAIVLADLYRVDISDWRTVWLPAFDGYMIGPSATGC